MPGGLISALFGRMVTSDPAANIDASIHVAHAFTVHGEESESDFWAAIDDLPLESEGAGAAHLNDMELTAGLFYGYVVVDLPGLVSNLEGCYGRRLADRRPAPWPPRWSSTCCTLIATVSPGAKLGSTAPYACADLMLVEAGNRQPRSSGKRFPQTRPKPRLRMPPQNGSPATWTSWINAMAAKEVRRLMHRWMTARFPGADRLCLDDLAAWAGQAIREGEVA